MGSRLNENIYSERRRTGLLDLVLKIAEGVLSSWCVSIYCSTFSSIVSQSMITFRMCP